MGWTWSACAETGTALEVEIDYEGSWVNFEQERFRLYLPSGWMLVDSEDAAFVVVSADLKQAMWIDVFAADGMTIDGVLESFQEEKAFTGVRAVYFNGVAFVCYTSVTNDLFGALTMSADGSTLYFFKFIPASDEGLGVLATKIMSSLTPME